jgi:hypothetical protein
MSAINVTTARINLQSLGLFFLALSFAIGGAVDLRP